MGLLCLSGGVLGAERQNKQTHKIILSQMLFFKKLVCASAIQKTNKIVQGWLGVKVGEEAWRAEGGGCPGMKLTRKGSRKAGKPKPRPSLFSWAFFFFFLPPLVYFRERTKKQ